MHFKKTILKNGLRVVMAPMKDTSTVTVIIAAGVGIEIRNKKNERHFAFFGAHVFQGDEKAAPDRGYFRIS